MRRLLSSITKTSSRSGLCPDECLSFNREKPFPRGRAAGPHAHALPTRGVVEGEAPCFQGVHGHRHLCRLGCSHRLIAALPASAPASPPSVFHKLRPNTRFQVQGAWHARRQCLFSPPSLRSFPPSFVVTVTLHESTFLAIRSCYSNEDPTQPKIKVQNIF